MTDAALARAVAAIADAAQHAAGDWWIIGSAAMVLSGVRGVEPQDVDILGPGATLMRFLDHWAVDPGPRRPSGRFRSYPYAGVDLPGCLRIETMGDLEVMDGHGWVPVRPRTRVPVATDAGTVFVPTLDEQRDILRLFGRPKDLAKVELIDAMA